MSLASPSSSLSRGAASRLAVGAAITAAVAIFGLYVVKWSPYYAKTFAAAAHHSLGASILGGTGAAAPAGTGWVAAWSYARAYFLAIWQALVLALLLGACVQVLIPQRWIARHLGRIGLRTTALAGVLSMAGMMCTCCTGPVVVGLRRQQASAGTAMGMFIGTPMLNPAVLLFIGFVLSWQLAALRLGVGLLVVVACAWLANRLAPAADALVAAPLRPTPIEDASAQPLDVLIAWLRVVWWELRTIVPGYVAIVLILGAVRAWLFQPGVVLHGASGIVATVVAAVAGTLFVIPTGAEVPIVQTFAHAGMGIGPSVALLLTLPAISLPSVFIVRSAFTPRILGAAMAAVALGGIVAAVVAWGAGVGAA